MEVQRSLLSFRDPATFTWLSPLCSGYCTPGKVALGRKKSHSRLWDGQVEKKVQRGLLCFKVPASFSWPHFFGLYTQLQGRVVLGEEATKD